MLAKQEGLTMIAVGVARMFISEVKDIASDNNAFSVQDFRSLPSLVYLLRDIICSGKFCIIDLSKKEEIFNNNNNNNKKKN